MKLSIITINYNNLEGLKKTVDSVLSQTWRDFEWIIVDGGSTDGSKEYIEKLAQSLSEGTAIDSVQWHVERFSLLGFTAEDLKTLKIESSSDQSSNHSSSIANRPQRFLWCSEPDKGVYNAMNKGIAKSQGEYLNFLNSGDFYNQINALEVVMQSVSYGDIMYGDCNFVKNENRITMHYESPLTLKTLFQNSIGHPTSFIKSSLLKENNYNEDFKIVSDWERFLQWYVEGRAFVHFDGAIVDFDVTGISSTRVDILQKERQKVLCATLSNNPVFFVSEMNLVLNQLKEYDNSEHKEVKRLIDRGHIRFRFISLICKISILFDKLIHQYR